MRMATVECIACGHVGEPKTKGSFFITIILLCIGFLPGVIYEIWRRSGGKVCSACGSNQVQLYRPVPKVVKALPEEHVQLQKKQSASKTKLVANDGFSYNAGQRLKIDDNGVEQKQCPDCREYIRFDARKCKHCGSIIE
ncbi:hypothetical protein HMPREF0018_00173 [Acinetobacter radioresistens SH164]|nr:hypothetical protein HMPREF0018_00173 [Acinetobacter radioresistens SH164]